jgi:hypothetical protein
VAWAVFLARGATELGHGGADAGAQSFQLHQRQGDEPQPPRARVWARCGGPILQHGDAQGSPGAAGGGDTFGGGTEALRWLGLAATYTGSDGGRLGPAATKKTHRKANGGSSAWPSLKGNAGGNGALPVTKKWREGEGARPYVRRQSGWGLRHPARGAAMVGVANGVSVMVRGDLTLPQSATGDLGWTDGPTRSNSTGCDLFKPFFK